MSSMKHRLPNLLPVVLVATVGILSVLTSPYLVSAYHLEAGSRAIHNPDLSAYDPLQAEEHLHKAIEWEPNNAQAYRLLGKVYREQDDWPAAVAALTRYTQLRPNNPLGYIELAEGYEAIEAEMAAMVFADLVTLLPQAEVKAPDVPVDTPYGQPDGPSWHYYVAETAFSLPPSFEERPTLFMHAPAQVTYTLSLPPQPTILRFGMGRDPEALKRSRDGAIFELFVNDQQVFEEQLEEAASPQGWQERTVNLAPWAGQEIALGLAVTPGPMGDIAGDWAGWGEPQVVDAQLPLLEALGVSEGLVAAWQHLGYTMEDFLSLGEEARKVGMYGEALRWYERSKWLEPNLGDPWYFAGLTYYMQNQQPQALASFETALAKGGFGSTARMADCHYWRGVVLRQLGANPDEYTAELQQAIEIDPQHPAAHVQLAWAFYANAGDATAAESEMLKALDLAPTNKYILYEVGEFYRKEGRTDEAAAMYRRALEVDPAFEIAQERLTQSVGEE
jgi:tetratricopeptide (TPR) repeat protein